MPSDADYDSMAVGNEQVRHRDPGDETAYHLEASPGFPYQGQRVVGNERHPIPSAPVRKRHDADASFFFEVKEFDLESAIQISIRDVEELALALYRRGWDAARTHIIQAAMDGRD